MFKLMFRAALAASLFVLIIACGDKQAQNPPAAPAPVVADAPDAAIRKWNELFKQGDIAGMLQSMMPPAIFTQFKTDVMSSKGNDKPDTDDDRQKFAAAMTMLTEPDAEQKLYARIEPQLKQFDAQYQKQLPMYIAMLTIMAQGKIEEDKDLSDANRQQVKAVLNAIGAWAQKANFTDPDSVKKVLAIAVKAVRDMNIKTLDELRALDFDQTMQRIRIVYLALRDALNVYGFSSDQVIDSARLEVVSNDGKTASVKMSYAVLGTPISLDATQMVNIDGRWYLKGVIDTYKKATATASASTAISPTAPATASAAPAAPPAAESSAAPAIAPMAPAAAPAAEPSTAPPAEPAPAAAKE